MSRRVVILGAGIAGLAAAFAAKRAGSEVTVVSAGPGASALSGGAVDDAPWEQLLRAARTLGVDAAAHPLDAEVMDLSRDLGIWDLPAERLAWLATAAGRLRPARGRDRSLLDLGLLRDTRVLLPRADRAGWDADAIADGLNVESFAKERRITFVAIDLPVIRFDDERRIADGDLALRHDEFARLTWLASRLREALGRGGATGAILLGPWLGARAPRADALSALVGVPVGEVLLGAGSPAGLRFEAARDRALATLDARVLVDRAVAVTTEDDGRLAVQLERAPKPLRADAVVLAVGGLVGGGLTYQPADHGAGADLPPSATVPFALSVRAEVTLHASLATTPTLVGVRGLGRISSLHGPELDDLAWPSAGRPGALEAAGVRCDGVRAAPQICAAGEAIAGRPRTVLEAVRSGLKAGREA